MSEQAQDPILAARLARIEEENARLRRLGMLSLAGLGIVLGVVVAVTAAFTTHLLPPPDPSSGRRASSWSTSKGGSGVAGA